MGVFSYSLGGLHLQADFPMPGLLAQSARKPDIRIVLAQGAPPSGVPVFAWPGRYGLQLASWDDQFLFSSTRDGAFLVSQAADLVQCFPAAGATPDAMLQLLVRRVLPRVAQRHGRTAVHGASIMLDQRSAVLVLGPSGAGKSTLSAALQRECGWPVLSDDISLIDCATLPARCFSVVHGACLWPDSLAALASDNMRSHQLPGHHEKRWREFDNPVASPSALVRAVIFLEPDGAPRHAVSLLPLAPHKALVDAMRQLIRFNPRDNAALECQMGKLARLLQHTPAYALAYPRAYAALPAVAQHLRTHFAAPCVAPSPNLESACQ